MVTLSHIISTYEEETKQIRYEIEDFFDNGERAGAKVLYEDGKKLGDLIEDKVKVLLRQFAADLIREAFAATKVENKEIPIIWQVVTRGSQAELAKRDRENFNAALALVEDRQQQFINEQQ